MANKVHLLRFAEHSRVFTTASRPSIPARFLASAVLAVLAASALPVRALPSPDAAELSRWQAQAARISIVRDDWGIAHVRGKTDADAVFGMVYAQAEDDFNRVETNYINAMGRLAEVEGESAIYQDLRMKMFVQPAALRAEYAASPRQLQALMNAWADGLNYYLATHPSVHPRLIRRFEPWMALSFTEGSIGGDIAHISIGDLRAFYAGTRQTASLPDVNASLREPPGSNGIAIAPSNTQSHRALLLINPHTSFFFRSELQMTSDEGLNAYGAVTWGQFFVYQGFNEHVGWMHTTSGVDAVDFFAETIARRGGTIYYRYGSKERPIQVSRIVVSYRASDGSVRQKSFTVYRTHRGPVVGERDGKWIDVALMQRPIQALSQSFLRTKATDYASFRSVAAAFQANSSNNTIFADSKGEIAYMSPQFVPRRNDRFDYTQPVDGADPASDWNGIHAIDESPHVVDPANGWVFNTNDWPYSSAGSESPKRANYPRYMDTAGENERGVHVTELLTGHTNFTLESLVSAAYDSYLPAFAEFVPRLVAAYDALPAGDPLQTTLTDQIAALRGWDDRWSASSVPTTLAVFWGEALAGGVAVHPTDRHLDIYEQMRQSTPPQQLAALAKASARLTADFGTWKTPWGEINRFQRRDDAIAQRFDDSAPSIPVPFTSGFWGSLAAFDTDHVSTKRRYGVAGNSFVAVVEFGDRVRAKAVTAGGESGDPASPHFDDQAVRYSTGNLRDVYYYSDQLTGHTVRTYHPGSE
jgi:acyl-homoserine-lactone acylase